ncbi:MAG: GNAT family N-acetyltransferase [Treponema sp.]|nr:GNAT family N-acetyltransferase [Treponema sp.]
MTSSYSLKIFPDGFVFLDTSDDCRAAAFALEALGYSEDFCLAVDFDPLFIARLMASGFLVMSCLLENPLSNSSTDRYILLPKHHLIRSCLFYPELHIKKSIKRFLPKYELVYDADFDFVLDKCIETHGKDWLTDPLVTAIREIRANPEMPAKPVSFSLYREGRPVAGEFGIIAGSVYTSYSGYYEEDNAGTVQMLLTAGFLEKNGFTFWDLGMPLDYKKTLGAREISRKEFMELFFRAPD